MESLTPRLRTFWRLDSVPVFLDALSSGPILCVCQFWVLPEEVRYCCSTPHSDVDITFITSSYACQKQLCVLSNAQRPADHLYNAHQRDAQFVDLFIHILLCLLASPWDHFSPLKPHGSVKARITQYSLDEYQLCAKTVREKQNINHEQNWKGTCNFSLKTSVSRSTKLRTREMISQVVYNVVVRVEENSSYRGLLGFCVFMRFPV